MAFNNIQRGVQNPNLLKRQLKRAGNPYSAIEKQYMFRQVRNAMGKNKKNNEKDEENKGGNNKAASSRSTGPTGSTGVTATQKVKRPNSVGRTETQEKNAEHQENGSYYASRDVTDNWRETWANAKPKHSSNEVRVQRPISSANSKVVRRRQVLADHIPLEQASGKRREPAKLDRGYRRSANDKMEPITVAYEDITDKQTASGSGNVAMLPETKRPVTNAQYALPDRSSKSNASAIKRNTAKAGPKVSGASFNHAPTRRPKEKTNPVMINQIKRQSRSGVAEAARSQIMSRPTTEQFKKEVAASKEKVRYQAELNPSDRNPILAQPETNRSNKPLSRPTTNQKTVNSKNPGPTRNSNRVSDSRPINKPELKVSNAINYNSATSKITDTAMKELKGSNIQVKRPEISQKGAQEKKINNTSVQGTESQKEKQEKKIQPATQSYPDKMTRRESSKSSQVRKTIRTAPKVQNAAVNGFKAYKGSSGQEVSKTARKGIKLPD
ncbi:hypothetical protein [Serratia marcescens]|uniref:hypothetical protein n=1 Tax=Serratia marcescens TaxID=615 RepID=UPI0011E64C26|nr:hypothetical protein [Serratia marcescens]